MQLFYAPRLKNNYHCFDAVESKHISKVLRLKEGDLIYLTDGMGKLYEGVLTQSDWKQCCVSYKLIHPEYGKRDYSLHIAIAPTKSIERFEWFIEKAVEIGIDEITPIICVNSERKIIKNERTDRIIVSAMKQSLKTYKPVLHPVTDFPVFIQQHFNETGMRFIAHCYESKKESISKIYSHGQDVLILIGPEGDFSPEEIEMAVTKGFRQVSLGECRLRTETAGVVACSMVSLLNQ